MHLPTISSPYRFFSSFTIRRSLYGKVACLAMVMATSQLPTLGASPGKVELAKTPQGALGLKNDFIHVLIDLDQRQFSIRAI